ncbi:MAG: hypothetical protein KatS3mg082_3080 [Nitrospiraceae bacterium]|nr:MAG: hypothetical protein KatS3mg082_3080 [Nitrospiraceae bacterium]
MTVKELREKYADVVRRRNERQQQGVAGQADRLAAAGAGRGRPVRTRPPACRGAGQRRRPAAQPAQGQARQRRAGGTKTASLRFKLDDRLPLPGTHHHPRVQGREAAGQGPAARLRVRGRGVQVAVRRGQGDHRDALQRVSLLPPQPERRYPMTRSKNRHAPSAKRRSAVPSTPASPPTRAWSRSSTRSTPSASRARRSSRARPMRAGRCCPTATTTAASPAATWTGPR